MESGQVASTASGKPVSPSQHTISTSCTPLLARSAHTWAQKEAPSPSWIQIPSTCLTPSMSTPTAMWAERFDTRWSARTLTRIASR